MVMDTLNLKAIPICYKKNAYHLNAKEFNIIKNIKYTNYGASGDNVASISAGQKTLLNTKGLNKLKKFMVQQAEDYTKNVLQIKDKIYLTQSWSTLAKSNATHHCHNHPNTFISVVYYAQCEKGFLAFDVRRSSLQEGLNLEYTVDKYNIYNSQAWDLPVETEQIVLFPGHIFHMPRPNPSPIPKILIGANFFIKGTLGSHESVSFLKI